MGTHIKAVFQKEVVVNGNPTWEDIDAKFDDPQDYDLFAWLANIRNYNKIMPLVPEMRGCPPDIKLSYEERCMDSSPCHWLLGSEIIAGMARHTDVRESAVISSWQKWDRKSRPECSSRHGRDDVITMNNPIVLRDSGYAANIWAERCAYKPFDYVHNRGFVIAPVRRRPSVTKHYEKLRKYLRRAGTYKYLAEWVFTADMRRESFAYLTDEVARLIKLHGNIRMVMSFG